MLNSAEYIGIDIRKHWIQSLFILECTLHQRYKSLITERSPYEDDIMTFIILHNSVVTRICTRDNEMRVPFSGLSRGNFNMT